MVQFKTVVAIHVLGSRCDVENKGYARDYFSLKAFGFPQELLNMLHLSNNLAVGIQAEAES